MLFNEGKGRREVNIKRGYLRSILALAILMIPVTLFLFGAITGLPAQKHYALTAVIFIASCWAVTYLLVGDSKEPHP